MTLCVHGPTNPSFPRFQQGKACVSMPVLQAGKAGDQSLPVSLEGMLEAGRRLPGKRRAFNPSSQQLQTLQLNEGQNTIEFAYGKQRLRAYLYFFNWNVR